MSPEPLEPETHRSVIVLLNPHAGHDASTSQAITTAFDAAGVEATVRQTDGARLHAAALDALTDGTRMIVAAGGDGTISAVASALAGTDVALGVLPLGTLNHFAKDLQIPTKLDDAANIAVAGQTMLVDVGEVNGRIFVNNSSVGAYPQLVVERRSQQKGKRLSEAIAAMRVLRNYRKLLVEVVGDHVDRVARTPFVFVGNNEYQLDGLDFGARPRLDAGTLHLCMAPDIGRMRFAAIVASALIGRLADGGRFESMCLPECAIRSVSRRLLVSLDGEVALLDTPLKYRIRRRTLRVVVPAGGSIDDANQSL
jgi:diacylglycerol kinase family enzyme